MDGSDSVKGELRKSDLVGARPAWRKVSTPPRHLQQKTLYPSARYADLSERARVGGCPRIFWRIFLKCSNTTSARSVRNPF
jgi:hypothetical protein